MKTIWKYQLSVTEKLSQVWAPGTKIVHVGPSEGRDDEIRFWLEHDPTKAGVGRAVDLEVFGTGHPIPVDRHHVGTAICGPFVWHLYARYR